MNRPPSERFPLSGSTVATILQEDLPPHLRRWWFALGGTPAFLFVVQIFTGVLLALYYRPDPAAAHESIRHITEEVAFGWYIRSLHKWAATFMTAAVALHQLRVFFTAAYRYPRELNWMIGTLLLVCTLMTGFTGYSLVFEQLSYWGATVGANIAGSVPVIGGLLRRLLLGGDAYNPTTLARLFIVHGAVLPVTTILLLAAHLVLVRLQGVSQLRFPGDEAAAGRRYRLIPDHLYVELTVILVLLIALSALATALPAQVGPPADPLTTPEIIKPEWFFYPMFRWLKLFSGTAALLTLGLAFFLAFLWPFVERLLARLLRTPQVSTWVGIATVAALLGLTLWEAIAPH